MDVVWNEAIKILSQRENFVLASVIGRTGSSPRAVGAVMLVCENGSIIASVGGGDIEAQVITAAQKLLPTGGWKKIFFDLRSDEAALQGMVCGGTTEIFLDVCTADDRNVFESARQHDSENKRGYLQYALKGSERNLTFVDEVDSAEGGDAIVSIPMCGNGTLYIFGAGHIAQETARIADIVGFKTVVIDDRAEFANTERFPHSQIIVLDTFSNFPPLHIDSNSYLVIATRGHIHDATALDFALGTDAGYVGMIGSRRKRDITYAEMFSRGHSKEQIDRVFSPIGLSIGSETPPEIAVSIVAELIQARSKKSTA